MAGLRHLPWPVWLDSGRPQLSVGRFDIFAAEPQQTVISRDGQGVLVDRAGRILETADDIFALLRAVMRERECRFEELPFCGGLIGYFGYDLGRRLEGVASRWGSDGMPELALGVYDWAVVTDHERRESRWVGRPGAGDGLELVRRALAAPPVEAQLMPVGDLRQVPGEEDYGRRFRRLQAYIRDGDCYQVNLARRFAAAYRGDPWAAYLALRAEGAAPFGAYLQYPFGQVLSVSPEQFLKVEGRRVSTRPIKGTRPRRAEPAEDRREAQALAESPKDRAENVMIVDLLRNDLGKVCRPGSVKVDELFKLESYPRVHHLVSSVSGELRDEVDALEVLRACLPGGSITGAPKHRAMEIIDELEPARRGVYCGAVGYLSDSGRLDTNIAIRTAICRGGELSYWAGGGIVADSVCGAEFEETNHKARQFVEFIRRSRGQ